MKALVKVAKNIKKINAFVILKKLSKNKEFTDLIIHLNTQKQLFEKGVNSEGRLLSDIGGDYSPATIEGTIFFKGKKQLHLPYDHITLFNKGEFYKSFEVFFNQSGFVISADTIKDTTNLITEWGSQILGLNEDSLILLREKAKELMIPIIKSLILKR